MQSLNQAQRQVLRITRGNDEFQMDIDMWKSEPDTSIDLVYENGSVLHVGGFRILPRKCKNEVECLLIEREKEKDDQLEI